MRPNRVAEYVEQNPFSYAVCSSGIHVVISRVEIVRDSSLFVFLSSAQNNTLGVPLVWCACVFLRQSFPLLLRYQTYMLLEKQPRTTCPVFLGEPGEPALCFLEGGIHPRFIFPQYFFVDGSWSAIHMFACAIHICTYMYASKRVSDSCPSNTKKKFSCSSYRQERVKDTKKDDQTRKRPERKETYVTTHSCVQRRTS